jgi:regulatory factor X, other
LLRQTRACNFIAPASLRHEYLVAIGATELFHYRRALELTVAQIKMALSPSHSVEDSSERKDSVPTKNPPTLKEKPRPKSRASTSSLQSVGVGTAFQPAQQHQPQDPQQQQPEDLGVPQLNPYFLQHGGHPASGMYGHGSEDMVMQYQHNMPAHLHQQPLDPNTGMPQHDIRPMSQQGFQDMQQFSMQYPHGLPPYTVGPQHMQHMRHHSEQFEGSPAPEDSNNENGGAKRRKGAASSMANDQELRRLLLQYQDRTLKEVAAEVQKNEGAGGKSEKAKQVFAMLWYAF